MANTNKTPKAQETKKAETKKVNPIVSQISGDF